jgi:hypothetical protein
VNCCGGYPNPKAIDELENGCGGPKQTNVYESK